MAQYGFVEHLLLPWYDEQSTVLILGTMPSVESRKRHCYYAHPQNRFWTTLAHVFQEDVALTAEERRAFCSRHGIALWDVLASCEIIGSGDASIRRPEVNNISVILENADIQAIFTTGKKAKALYDELIFPLVGKQAVALPSTSPANRRWASQEILDREYAILTEYCR